LYAMSSMDLRSRYIRKFGRVPLHLNYKLLGVDSASNVYVHCTILIVKSKYFSTYCIGKKMKYGRDESNKIGGDKKHPSKYRKRKYIEYNF
jgi:hypothetical protein